ncbi:MAG: hypothetical protein CM1200mP29_11610 [Verrucomicrobiota bacterium]|nr:MAG: hypothetical protein CM1200mP29_11610 [Verrucomicrobiota bacterium]
MRLARGTKCGDPIMPRPTSEPSIAPAGVGYLKRSRPAPCRTNSGNPRRLMPTVDSNPVQIDVFIFRKSTASRPTRQSSSSLGQHAGGGHPRLGQALGLRAGSGAKERIGGLGIFLKWPTARRAVAAAEQLALRRLAAGQCAECLMHDGIYVVAVLPHHRLAELASGLDKLRAFISTSA